jgi:hypothetical protein
MVVYRHGRSGCTKSERAAFANARAATSDQRFLPAQGRLRVGGGVATWSIFHANET